MAVARYLVANGAIVTACVKSAAELGARYVELTSYTSNFNWGPGYLANLERFDALPKHLPELRLSAGRRIILQ